MLTTHNKSDASRPVKIVSATSNRIRSRPSIDVEDSSDIDDSSVNTYGLCYADTIVTNKDIVNTSINDMNMEKDEIIPDNIIARYSTDFNIVRVHDLIKLKLRKEKLEKVFELKECLNALHEKIQTPQTIIERVSCMENIQKIKDKIHTIGSGERLREYLEGSEGLVRRYKELGTTKRRVIFDDVEPEKAQELSDKDHDRLLIIDRYLEIARKYIPIDIIKDINNSNFCKGCGANLEREPIDDDGCQRCNKCGAERYLMSINCMSKDTKRINTSLRNEYSDFGNFWKTLRRYQGLQPNRIPKDLYNALDVYFAKRCRPSKEEIREMPLNDRGFRGDTDLKMLYEALSSTGYTDNYEDANLIGHIYWDWKLPDVRHLESIIMSDYERTQKVLNKLPNKDRKSSLGTQYRLFKHLELRGHQCRKEDFKIAEMLESLEFHDYTWQKMCEGCNDPEIYFISTI